MTLDTQREDRQVTGRAGFVGTLTMVPRRGRWTLPGFASASRGTDASTLEPQARTLLHLRVAAVDRAPHRPERLEAGAQEPGINEDEVQLVGHDGNH